MSRCSVNNSTENIAISSYFIFLSSTLCLRQNGLEHLVTHFRSLGEPRREVLLNFFEFLPVRVEVAETDTVAPILVQHVSQLTSPVDSIVNEEEMV